VTVVDTTVDVPAMARRLFTEHNLTGWAFAWSNRRAQMGVCEYNTKTVRVSRHLTGDPTELVDTLLHEVAHAIAGPLAGHGPEWQAWAVRLGARPKAAATITQDEVDDVYLWVGVCPNCGNKTGRFRLTAQAKRRACGDCCDRHNGGRWSEQFVWVWTRNPNV
jgi:predicted SprT family Zn-dependent metalloprotease